MLIITRWSTHDHLVHFCWLDESWHSRDPSLYLPQNPGPHHRPDERLDATHQQHQHRGVAATRGERRAAARVVAAGCRSSPPRRSASCRAASRSSRGSRTTPTRPRPTATADGTWDGCLELESLYLYLSISRLSTLSLSLSLLLLLDLDLDLTSNRNRGK